MAIPTNRELERSELIRKAARAEAARKLPQAPFLRDDKRAQRLEVPAVQGLPFPPASVTPLPGGEYLLEQVSKKWYLRSCAVSQFCLPVTAEVRKFSQADFNGTGVTLDSEFRVPVLCVVHMGNKFCVGYSPSLSKPPVLFLPAFVSSTPVEELPAAQAVLYLAADHARPTGGGEFVARLIAGYEGEMQRPSLAFEPGLLAQRQQAAQVPAPVIPITTHPSPRGAWESELFDIAFGGDPALMSDEEYEMVFGQAR